MATIIFWSSIGILVLTLIIGLLTGLVRGLKRSAIHIGFLVASIVVAFFLTKTITNAILGITLPIDNGKYTVAEYILHMISKSFDISSFDGASTFITNLPNAVASPIIFIVLSFLVFFLFDIIYLITTRLAFGKKKEDFKEHKPHRAYGAIIGIFEGIIMVVLMFGPLSSLTGIYKELSVMSPTTEVSTSAVEQTEQEEQTSQMQTISQLIKQAVPKEADEIIVAWDKSVCGKLPKLFGLNNLLFDNLSSFKVKGEKIVIRKEIRDLAYAYDDFVDVYNKIKSNNIDKLNFADLRMTVGDILDGGLFRGVIADGFETLVVKYEELKTKLPFTFPALLDEMIIELKNSFVNNSVNTTEYLKHDIMAVIDAMEILYKNDLINKYNSITQKDFVNIMKFIETNNSNVGYITKKIVSLNIVEDSFNILINKASEQVTKMFEGKEFEVKLNTAIENINSTIDDVLRVVDNVVDLNNYIDFSELLTTNDIVKTLTSVENIYKTMEKTGMVFDSIRELDLLVVKDSETEQPIYMFDNILKNFGVELLGDEVYLNLDATEKTKLDSYTKFFSFLAGPIDVAKDLGLTDFNQENVTFESILDKILLALKLEDTQILTRVVMPFYQLNCMDLRKLVFDTVVENLNKNVSLLSLDEIIQADDYHIWVEEFNHIGKTLDLLNTGKNYEDGTSEIEGYNDTYVKYLLSGSSDLKLAMKAMLENNRLGGILDEVFTARVFKNLTNEVFTILDNSVKSLTGTESIDVSTNLENLQNTKQNTIETIEGILKTVLSESEISISDYGKVLQLLKVNASNGGAKNGVFNNIFMNIIWYLTGDDLTTEQIYSTLTPNANANDIKKFLNISDYYADEVNFEELMEKAESAINLAKKFSENIDFKLSENNSISDVVNGIENSLADMTETEKVEAIQNLESLLAGKNEELLDNTYTQEMKNEISSAIEQKFGQSSELSNALKSLLKV